MSNRLWDEEPDDFSDEDEDHTVWTFEQLKGNTRYDSDEEDFFPGRQCDFCSMFFGYSPRGYYLPETAQQAQNKIPIFPHPSLNPLRAEEKKLLPRGYNSISKDTKCPRCIIIDYTPLIPPLAALASEYLFMRV